MSDEEILRNFEDCTYPLVEWNQRAHVRVAFIYLSRFPYEAALTRMRNGIKKYNAAHQVPENQTSGYNETTTCALFHIIAATMQAYAKTHPVSTSDEFCDMHPQLMNKHVLRLFYTPGRRMEPGAKTEFLEPDLAPLPRRIGALIKRRKQR